MLTNTLIAAVSILLALVPLAFAATPSNLVTNGGFESNGEAATTLTGWSNPSDSPWQTYNAADVPTYQIPVDKNTYSIQANGLDANDPSVLSQTISTMSGYCYTLSFDYTTGGGTLQDLAIGWSFGSTHVALPATPSTSYVTYTSAPLQATGSDTLSFSAWSELAYPGLDQVSLVEKTGYLYNSVQGACIVPYCSSLYSDCTSGANIAYNCCLGNSGIDCASKLATHMAQCTAGWFNSNQVSCSTSACCSSTFQSATGISTAAAETQQSSCANY